MDQNNQYNPPNAWQTNAFNSQFQNALNSDDYPVSPFVGGNPMQSFLGSFFPPPNTLQYSDGNSDSFMHSGDFQPEVGLFNGTAFAHNESANPNPQFSPAQFNIPQVAIPTPPRPPTDYNARAAELKAELLKRQKSRATSSTPPVVGKVAKPVPRPEGSSSLRGSPQTPITLAEMRDQELNVNDLISQYSESKPAANASVNQEKPTRESFIPSQQQHSTNSGISAKSQAAPSLGSPTKVAKPVVNGKKADGKTLGLGKRDASNGSLSEASEGEILEDATSAPAKSFPAAKPKEAQIVAKFIRNDEPQTPSRDEQITKPLQLRARDDSPPRRPSTAVSKAQPLRVRDVRREEFDQRPERRLHQQEFNNDRKQFPEPGMQVLSRRNSRDEDYPRSEQNADRNRAEISRPTRELRPTLQDLLPLDDDLREWLEITGYHNAPYRNKILNRRRAIAALDAQRDKLLAEMQAEERGGIPAAIVGQMPSSSMLPPPLPNKAEFPTANSESEFQRGQPISNKRSYSDDQREGPNPGKFPRLEDQIPVSRVKEEDDFELRRPRSRGNEIVHRQFDPHDDRDTSRGRYDSRARSRERDVSPGRRAYEGRPPARIRPHDEVFSDREDLQERETRPFEVRGRYQGRAFDPNFRGGGRGRGRGRGRSNSRERNRDLQRDPEPKNDHSPFGSRIANGRPFRDSKGFDRGGKGDTRYFIVKSFNEENVLRCIEDSIWTTQKQNGDIFKKAFETCKNVILVFSINKSRAFQGYARMESIPGSVNIPEWQHAINWESAGAFKVKWLVICSTRFHRIGHLKNALNENQAVLIGKDGQEIEQKCGSCLIEFIDEEAQQALAVWRDSGDMWDDEI